MEKIKEATMEREKIAEKKSVEFFEMCMKMQKEFLENWMKSQKEFMENWLEGAKKLQESFLNLDSGQLGKPAGKDMLGMYNTWFNTMVNSSKVFTDEAMKMQETWKGSAEKQMEMSREIFKNFSAFSSQATGR